ncbi:MAG TPA: PorT family protein [Leeuwenhoekiella sp.]|nr:PorT family protein [Leeuwenhoekiella sp.]
MKKALLGLFLIMGSISFAQSSYGIKAGLNYNGNGDVTDSAGDVLENPDHNVGYHVGVFGKIGNTLFFRPELLYTNTKSSYDDDRDFKMQKLDLPLLVGVRIFGPLNIFAGPSLQYILDTDYDQVTLGDVEHDLTVGAQFGVGVNIGRLGVDLRYERGLSDNEARFIDTNIVTLENGRIDTRPDQVILSFSLEL